MDQIVTESKSKQQVAHQHEESSFPVISFLIGVVLFVLSLIDILPISSSILFVIVIIISGYHVIWEGIQLTISDSKKQLKFTPNIHLLMSLAALGAVLIGNYQEAALLILIFAGAHFLEEYAEGKSKREISKLLKMNPTEGRRINEDGQIKIVPVSELKLGDKIQVLNGDQIPTDGQVIDGMTTVDESAINGESMPKEKQVGDLVFGGTINGNGILTVIVTKDSRDTVFAKIVQLVAQSQQNISPTATKIKKIEPVYVKTVLLLLPVFILIGYTLIGWSFEQSIYRGMVFLISVSPCALAASAVPATLSAISNLAKRGVLFKGGSYLSNLAEIKAIAFDKTGTLTEGKPKVTDYYLMSDSKREKAQWLSIIVALERQANHPLAEAIVSRFTEAAATRLVIEVNNQVGAGLNGNYQGNYYQLGKPSIFNTVNQKIVEKQEQFARQGKTVVYFAINHEVVGLIALMDIANPKAKQVIDYLNAQRIHTTLITGDSELTGQAIGSQLGLTEVITNVMPEDKSAIINTQKQKFGIVGMVGDGINDAPALVNADIGIAMGDGTDIAIDVSDVVLMNNDLSKLSYAHRISKKLNQIVYQNIFFSLLIIILLVTLNFIGKMDISIGVLAHEGSTLLVIFNGLRLLIPVKD
ncbi:MULTISPECIES: heavy metal translocating P-type ATPase [unclassified Enterococcus]|uniref:heavy metal translocating P-type ATPase n=1 Tax=unclassified Enterococcus TaxID=2608891 RepID=UPI001556A6FF|nr:MULTISPECIES: heavy metal translocating P-type ATPase [unclassified Enterococcus]MBS7578106.1 heavy metal translocating P-type ATPase [Enterococcus sp. MMGLQ5-2]MBS7585366.1 heavy metal translocating P-type ATPase [Enterococcus sp. MMGLQ5-1]NPD13223.1 heavy metal translocating P-type ATPase [Enterococcus sp. MMGLQ5-1]NPD37937.1 heavy metal translocating P-type ATPase [Enterococcus sp. MMGLQ5-2]